jgi:hypothetical protein
MKAAATDSCNFVLPRLLMMRIRKGKNIDLKF